MYSFNISVIDGSLEITTKMLSLQSPRMALESYGFEVDDRSFKKGDIVFDYFRDHNNAVCVQVWEGDAKIAYVYHVKFVNVLLVEGYVVLTTPTYKVTINVD